MTNYKWKKITVLMLCMSFIQITYTHAEDVTITVNGSVVAQPCAVATTNVTVNLGDLYTFDLISAGSSSEWRSFSLDLINCPIATSNVTATFSGITDTTGYYKNQGTATSIQLQLQDTEGNDLKNNTNKTLQVNNSTLSISFPLRVRALSVNGKATQGNIQAIINVTYTYS